MKEELGKTYWIKLSCLIRSIYLPCGSTKSEKEKLVVTRISTFLSGTFGAC